MLICHLFFLAKTIARKSSAQVYAQNKGKSGLSRNLKALGGKDLADFSVSVLLSEVYVPERGKADTRVSSEGRKLPHS